MRPAFSRLLLALVLGTTTTVAVLSINRSWLTPGAHSDAVQYLTAAESLVADGQLRIPTADWSSQDSTSVLSHYPPGFSALISIPMRWGVRAHPAALWVMAASAGAAMALGFLLFAGAFGIPAALLGAALLVSTPALTRLHLAIWSESSYVAVTMALLLLMVARPRWAGAHGVLAAVALTVRYVGVAGTATAVLWAWRSGGSLRQRVWRAAWAAGPSMGFLIWWRHYVAARHGVVRHLGFYPDVGTNFGQLPAMLRTWLVPAPWHGNNWTAGFVLFGSVLLIGASWLAGAWREPERRGIARGMALYSLLYVATVMVARLIADPAVPFDERIFLPVIVLATLTLGAAALSLGRYLRPGLRTALLAMLAAWCVAGQAEIRSGMVLVNKVGRYYTFATWLEDPVIRWVDNHSYPYQVLYSNEAELIYYQTGRHARRAPVQGEDLAVFAKKFGAVPSALVVVQPLHRGDIPGKTLARQLGLEVAAASNQAVVYVAPCRRRSASSSCIRAAHLASSSRR